MVYVITQCLIIKVLQNTLKITVLNKLGISKYRLLTYDLCVLRAFMCRQNSCADQSAYDINHRDKNSYSMLSKWLLRYFDVIHQSVCAAPHEVKQT